MSAKPVVDTALEDIERSYVRIRAQVDWLLAQASVDEPTVARAVAAALQGTPILGIAEGPRQNVIWRLAFLWGLRGPWLTAELLMSGPLRLEHVMSGEARLVDTLDALVAHERASGKRKPGPLQQRLREFLGEDARGVDSLWSMEAPALQPLISSWRDRVRSDAGAAILEEVGDAVANGLVEAASPSERPPLTDVDALIARARADVPPDFFDVGFVGDALAMAEARADVEAALALAPTKAAALGLRAWLRLLGRDDLAAARTDILHALAEAPEEGQHFVALARIEQATGRFAVAVDACTRALSAARPAKEGLALRALCRVMSGDAAGAKVDADAAIAADAADVSAHYVAGEVCTYLGDVDGALHAFDEALAIVPDHAATLLRRSELFAATGQHARALLDADRTVELTHARDAYYNRGTIRLEAKDLLGAAADFTAALTRDPTDVQSLLNRGTVQAMRKDMNAANADWHSAAEIAPTYPPARLKRAMGRIHSGKMDRAIVDDLRAALRYAAPDWPARGEVEQLLARAEAQVGTAN